MRERPEDTGIAIALAIGVHVLAVALMFIGWLFTPEPEVLSVAGPPIEVELVAAAPTRDRARPAAATPPPPAPTPVEQEAAPPPQPAPEPAPQDAMVQPQPAPQAPQVVPDVRNQERVSRDAVSPEPPAPREQEERRAQEQVDLTERERQNETEERQRRSAQQLERLRQLAALQQRRADASSQSRMQQERLEQQRDLAQRQPPSPDPPAAPTDAQATPLAGNNGVDTSLRAAYVLAIQNAVERNWRRPETIPQGMRCRLEIVQIPGGDVINVNVDASCPYDAIARDSLERAVFAAAPLPYAGFESVFERKLGLTFKPAD